MASKIFFSHQKVYFWISGFDHRAIVVPKMHIVQWLHAAPDHIVNAASYPDGSVDQVFSQTSQLGNLLGIVLGKDHR